MSSMKLTSRQLNGFRFVSLGAIVEGFMAGVSEEVSMIGMVIPDIGRGLELSITIILTLSALGMYQGEKTAYNVAWVVCGLWILFKTFAAIVLFGDGEVLSGVMCIIGIAILLPAAGFSYLGSKEL